MWTPQRDTSVVFLGRKMWTPQRDTSVGKCGHLKQPKLSRSVGLISGILDTGHLSGTYVTTAQWDTWTEITYMWILDSESPKQFSSNWDDWSLGHLTRDMRSPDSGHIRRDMWTIPRWQISFGMYTGNFYFHVICEITNLPTVSWPGQVVKSQV